VTCRNCLRIDRAVSIDDSASSDVLNIIMRAVSSIEQNYYYKITIFHAIMILIIRIQNRSND